MTRSQLRVPCVKKKLFLRQKQPKRNIEISVFTILTVLTRNFYWQFSVAQQQLLLLRSSNFFNAWRYQTFYCAVKTILLHSKREITAQALAFLYFCFLTEKQQALTVSCKILNAFSDSRSYYSRNIITTQLHQRLRCNSI